MVGLWGTQSGVFREPSILLLTLLLPLREAAMALLPTVEQDGWQHGKSLSLGGGDSKQQGRG